VLIRSWRKGEQSSSGPTEFLDPVGRVGTDAFDYLAQVGKRFDMQALAGGDEAGQDSHPRSSGSGPISCSECRRPLCRMDSWAAPGATRSASARMGTLHALGTGCCAQKYHPRKAAVEDGFTRRLRRTLTRARTQKEAVQVMVAAAWVSRVIHRSRPLQPRPVTSAPGQRKSCRTNPSGTSR
jgi:hypothetical protein